MPRYAQLDASNRAIGYSDLSGEVDAPHMILIGDDEDYTGWTYSGGVWVEPTPVEPEPSSPVATPPQIKACALRINLSDGEVTMVGGAFNVVSLINVDVGTFWAFFENEITIGTPYLVPNNGISVDIADWQQSYCVLEIRDHAGGTLINPVSFGFTLYTF